MYLFTAISATKKPVLLIFNKIASDGGDYDNFRTTKKGDGKHRLR